MQVPGRHWLWLKEKSTTSLFVRLVQGREESLVQSSAQTSTGKISHLPSAPTRTNQVGSNNLRVLHGIYMEVIEVRRTSLDVQVECVALFLGLGLCTFATSAAATAGASVRSSLVSDEALE